MADTSSFSVVDDAVWAALQDVSSTDGAALRAWRSEQYASGHWGRDFDQLTDKIPGPNEFKDTDSPALCVITAGASTLEDVAPDYRSVLYPVAVVGFLRSRRTEVDVQKKLKRFGELTWRLLAYHKRTCFGLSSSQVGRTALVGIQWPDLELENLFRFQIDLAFEVVLST